MLLVALAGQFSDRAEADRLFRAREFERAARIYFDLLRSKPDDDGLMAATSQAMVEAGHSRQALPLLARCAASRPEDTVRQRYLARALIETNQMLAAEEVLSKLTARDPKDGLAWFYLGALRYQNGYYPAALEYFDRALSLPDAGAGGTRNLAKIYRASSLAQVGRLEESETLVNQLLSDPAMRGHIELRLTRAQILYETGRHAAALEESARAAQSMDGNPMAHAWMAKSLIRLGRLKEAEEAARRAAARGPALSLPHSLLLEIYRRTSRTAEAANEAAWLREFENRKAQP